MPANSDKPHLWSRSGEKKVREGDAPYATTWPDLEARRLRLQKAVDASKTSLQRNQLGQFSTPFPLACDIASYTSSLLTPGSSCAVLEPASGSGVFVSALIAGGNLPPQHTVTCVEIDSAYADICRDLFSPHRTETVTADFFQFLASTPLRFDMVVTNPPYVRHHHIDGQEKQRLQRLVLSRLGIQVSGLSGLYLYYVLLADALLRDSAIASWLVPSEFLYTNYGKALRTYLADKVTLLRIHRFDATDVQFDDALVSSCVVTYRKAQKPKGHAFDLTTGRYGNPSTTERIACDSPRSLEKDVLREGTAGPLGEGTPLEALFHITRGMATGCNDFFILDEQDILDRKLEPECLVPILPGPRTLRAEVVDSDACGMPRLEKRLCLLSVTIPIQEVQVRYPHTYAYLLEGEKKGVSRGYICQSRKQWYYQDKRPAPLYVATYMGRGRAGACPIRFILNRSQAVATNVFLCLYPRPHLSRMLQGHPERQEELLAILNGIPPEDLLAAGRSYGGGLQKVEPKELRSVKLRRQPTWLDLPRFEQPDFLGLFSRTLGDGGHQPAEARVS